MNFDFALGDQVRERRHEHAGNGPARNGQNGKGGLGQHGWKHDDIALLDRIVNEKPPRQEQT